MAYAEKDLSQWFELDKQKPWEVGVYEVDSDFGYAPMPAKSYWDGDKWHFTCTTHAQAYKHKDLPTWDKIVKWRGLSAKPSAPKPKANKRVTLYRVMARDCADCQYQMIAGFFTAKEAEAFIAHRAKRDKRLRFCVKKLRFRTPEAV